MMETYSAGAPVGVVQTIGRGSPLPAAILEVTGDQYRDLRVSFTEWLQQWEDPKRLEIRTYLQAIDSIMNAADLISERRAADIRSGATLSSRLPVKRALTADSEALVVRLAGLSAPSALMDTHQDATTYIARLAQWLTLELNYSETLEAAKLLEANDMIPEVNTRETTLRRSITVTKFVYNLQD